MPFLVEYDPMKPVCTGDDKELAKFLDENNLSRAFGVVSCADELGLMFDANELNMLAKNTNSGKDTEEMFDNIEAMELPTLAKVRKRLVKEPKDTPEPEQKAPKAKAKSAPRKTTKRTNGKEYEGMVFVNGNKKSREGTVYGTIAQIVEDNMGEAVFEDIIKDFTETYTDKNGNKKDENFARRSVIDAIKDDRLIGDDL